MKKFESYLNEELNNVEVETIRELYTDHFSDEDENKKSIYDLIDRLYINDFLSDENKKVLLTTFEKIDKEIWEKLTKADKERLKNM